MWVVNCVHSCIALIIVLRCPRCKLSPVGSCSFSYGKASWYRVAPASLVNDPPPPSPLVFQTTWVKKAGMKVLWQGKDGTWYNCTLELERGVGNEMDGKLTIQFKLKHKHKVSSYMCVLSVDWQDKPCASKESMLTVVVKRDG